MSDKELINHYQQTGQSDSIGILFDRYVETVYLAVRRYIKNRENARDTVMDVFELLLEQLKKDHFIESFPEWLFVVVRNHCFQKLRKGAYRQSQQREIEKNTKKSLESVENDSLFHHIKREDAEFLQQQLEKAFNHIKKPQKTCLQLFYFKKKSYQEIIELTGYSFNEVKSHIQNGKKNMKKLLQQHDLTDFF